MYKYENNTEIIDEVTTVNNHFTLAVAVMLSTVSWAGTFFFMYDFKVSCFIGIIVFVLIYKYKTIKEYFTKNLMRLFNIE